MDFDKNIINIGLNKGTKSAKIIGSSKFGDDDKNEKSEGAVIFVIVFLSIMVITALTFFYKARKEEQQRIVTFAKPRYRNGVEVKPSEAGYTAVKASGKHVLKEKILVEKQEDEEKLERVEIN